MIHLFVNIDFLRSSYDTDIRIRRGIDFRFDVEEISMFLTRLLEIEEDFFAMVKKENNHGEKRFFWKSYAFLRFWG